MKRSSYIAFSLLAIAFVGTLLKTTKIPFSDVLYKVSMFTLADFLFLQTFLGKPLPAKYANFFQRVASIGMCILTVGIISRFSFWMGWQLHVKLGIVLSCFSLPVLFQWNKIKKEGEYQHNYLKYNYLFPLAFLVACCAVSYAVPDKTFYQTFSSQSKTLTYEQFQAKVLTNQNRTHSAAGHY